MTPKDGVYIVRQVCGRDVIRTDYDASEWDYRWLKYDGVSFLRMEHTRDPDATDSMDFVEYSLPVSLEFQYTDD